MQSPPESNEAVAKCQCTNCHGHLEFDAVHAGETVECPHCGANTGLYLPHVAKVPVRAVPPPVTPAMPPVFASSIVHDIDQVFYSNGPVVVTKTRFVSFAETFAIS